MVYVKGAVIEIIVVKEKCIKIINKTWTHMRLTESSDLT